jgi:hypothetical protein
MAKDLESSCPSCLVPNDSLDQNDTEFRRRDSHLQTRAVEVALGLRADPLKETPTPHSLGIRPVIVRRL